MAPHPYDSRQTANVFINMAQNDGRQMSVMRLLKLLYFAHGWCLALYDRPLINDYVEAWKFGPVVSMVYFAFRPQGIHELNPMELVHERELCPDTLRLLDWIDDNYGALTDRQLSLLTHVKGGPWHQVYRPNVSNIVIPNDLIASYFRKKSKEVE